MKEQDLLQEIKMEVLEKMYTSRRMTISQMYGGLQSCGESNVGQLVQLGNETKQK